mmetsp:Transcript_11563/g.24798  ORF Transcript_11563/g.24798 Transcript_11563/m.24798 type:complete len:83 (+) Transcript_11563:1375-1623(+)
MIHHTARGQALTPNSLNHQPVQQHNGHLHCALATHQQTAPPEADPLALPSTPAPAAGRHQPLLPRWKLTIQIGFKILITCYC